MTFRASDRRHDPQPWPLDRDGRIANGDWIASPPTGEPLNRLRCVLAFLAGAALMGLLAAL